MEANELSSIWAAYDAKLEKSIKLNAQCLTELKTQKVKSAFSGFLRGKIAEMILASFFVFFFGNFIYEHIHQIHFVLPGAILLAFCIMIIHGCINQFILVKQVDYTNGVASCQKKIALLQSAVLMQSSFLRYTRIALLSIPLYTAWIIVGFETLFGFDIYTWGDQKWWYAQIAFSIALIPLTIWLYKKISYKNIHTKWVKRFIDDAGARSLAKAMEYLEEIENFEKELD